MGAFGVTEKPAERSELVKCSSRSARRLKQKPPIGAAQGCRGASAEASAAVPELAGAKVLIVDDDIRNIYSLTSVLESHDVEVLHAERGKGRHPDP
jgi:PleD family two-component response regulator